MTYRCRSTASAYQLCLLVLLVVLFLLATPSPAAAAQGSEAAANTQTLSLHEYGVTVQIPPGWSHHQYANVHELVNLPPEKMQKPTALDLESAANIHMGSLPLRSHSEAVERLGIVAAERKAQPTFLVIGGWPALQRQVLVPKPERGAHEDSEKSRSEPGKMLVLVTTAVAVGNSVFRIDGTVAAESLAANAIAEQMKQIGRELRFEQAGNPARAADEVQKLQSGPSSRPTKSTIPRTMSELSAQTISATSAQTSSEAAGLAFFNTTLGGLGTEPEIAVSTSGKNIVIASQFSGVSSQNGGQSFSAPFNFPNTACGDSSLAFGRSGNFYEGSIGTVNAACDAQRMDVAVNNGGASFAATTNPFVCNAPPYTMANPVNCDFVGMPTPNGVPDQEHIAADRFNAGPTGGDQVYVVWRRARNVSYGITCSSDSGTTWTAAAFNGDGTPDFPRVAVGQDGLVYVIYTNGDNIEVDRYTSCANGLTNQLTGGVVAMATAEVVCPIAGLDRCGGLNGFFRNDLRSPTVAVDDTNASHIYAAYATDTTGGTGGNENVVIAGSFSRGNNMTWSTPTPMNNLINGRRYLPWLCSVGGTAFASWYDRRNATATTNDVTDYFAGSAKPSGGILTAGPDFQINATGDPQCASGWPNAPDLASYSESCFVQPQLAGLCSDGVTRCDFAGPDATVCPNVGMMAGTCNTSNGQPKYGDFNGNTCAAGRLYTVWGSATSQPGAAAAVGIELFFSEKLVCCVPQIQSPGPLSLTTCSGSSTTTTANICNTGKADLQINSITPSNSQFTVTQPSSGFPVTISPDFCFPFEVKFTPTGTGTTNASLTVASNDTVNPSVIIPVTGTAPSPSINTTIANSGSFGNVCAGNQADLTLQVLNQGQCNLNITNITSSNSAFVLPAGVTLPLVLSADASVNVPIRFSPTGACSNTVAQSSTITINSNDPLNGTITQSVSGIEGCPKLVLSPQNLTGAFAFPATVSDPTGTLGCYTDRNITVSNSGICPLTITSLTTANGLDGVGAPLAASPLEFSVINPTTPVTIAPGAAPVPITVRFKPVILTDQFSMAPDQQTGILTIVSNDPVAADNTAGLCGEPTVHSGARVLVVNSLSNPVSSVASITLSSKGLTPPFNEKLMPAPLMTATNICGNTILYHLDNETLRPAGTTGSNPLASYVLSAKNGFTHANMSFTLGQCQMRQIILQIK